MASYGHPANTMYLLLLLAFCELSSMSDDGMDGWMYRDEFICHGRINNLGSRLYFGGLNIVDSTCDRPSSPAGSAFRPTWRLERHETLPFSIFSLVSFFFIFCIFRDSRPKGRRLFLSSPVPILMVMIIFCLPRHNPFSVQLPLTGTNNQLI